MFITMSMQIEKHIDVDPVSHDGIHGKSNMIGILFNGHSKMGPLTGLESPSTKANTVLILNVSHHFVLEWNVERKSLTCFVNMVVNVFNAQPLTTIFGIPRSEDRRQWLLIISNLDDRI